MTSVKIIFVAGARPNFMKVAPLVRVLERRSGVRTLLVHTGQHYDPEMSEVFLNDLRLPKPRILLGVGSGSHADQTARIMTAFERVVLEERPDAVVVVGDVNSTLACALVAAKVAYPMESASPRNAGNRPLIAHVEAGLRSFDRSMPEEINRIVTDILSDLLFTTSRGAGENLKREGASEEKIFFVGNVMIDTLLKYRRRAHRSLILGRMGLEDQGRGAKDRPPRTVRPYAVCTLHRPSNVDDERTFLGILEALQEIGRKVPIIYPIHPRAKSRIESFGLGPYVTFSRSMESIDPRNSITCIEPLGYLDFLQLMANARLILTDSGGIQEETTILGIPCVTIRENTERPVTISEGTNVLAGVERRRIVQVAGEALNGFSWSERIPEKWDGKAAERIVEIILERLSDSETGRLGSLVE